jgi:hypothetical protein
MRWALEYSYDSDKKGGSDKGSEELSKTFAGMIGKKYTVTLTPKGKVIKIEGLKESLRNSPRMPHRPLLSCSRAPLMKRKWHPVILPLMIYSPKDQ